MSKIELKIDDVVVFSNETNPVPAEPVVEAPVEPVVETPEPVKVEDTTTETNG